MVKILFLCHGNICRSPMAEFVMKYLVNGKVEKFEIASSATSYEEIGNDIHYGTKQKLRENGIPFEKRAAVRFTQSDYNYYDYIIVMDERNIINLKRIIGEDQYGKIYKLKDFTTGGNVADPWYTGNFDETYRDILEGCIAFLDFLERQKDNEGV